jgi:hypothetical protein
MPPPPDDTTGVDVKTGVDGVAVFAPELDPVSETKTA